MKRADTVSQESQYQGSVSDPAEDAKQKRLIDGHSRVGPRTIVLSVECDLIK